MRTDENNTTYVLKSRTEAAKGNNEKLCCDEMMNEGGKCKTFEQCDEMMNEMKNTKPLNT